MGNLTELTKVVVEELLQIMEWIVQLSKVGNPIRRFIGMQDVIVTVDAGSGVGWGIDGKNREESLSARVKLVACSLHKLSSRVKLV